MPAMKLLIGKTGALKHERGWSPFIVHTDAHGRDWTYPFRATDIVLASKRDAERAAEQWARECEDAGRILTP